MDSAPTVFRIEPGLEEQRLWSEFALPRLRDLSLNVLQICEYGFTEMVNNVIDHSQSETIALWAREDEGQIELRVGDFGVGIFHKIQQSLNLPDEHAAAIELAKGKVTTSPDRHTGEGIFFTARMFDSFSLSSHGTRFSFESGSQDWLFESAQSVIDGTLVSMGIARSAQRTTRDVFDRFATGEGGFEFDTTILVIGLFGNERSGLVSRSQAKRVLSRLDRFKTVLLDFKGIEAIGPAFADEIFRVFATAHPEVRVIPVNAGESVTRAILRATDRNGQSP